MTRDDQEKAFYREQSDRLGSQLLRLKEELAATGRELHRQRTVATVVQTLFDIARSGLTANALRQRFLSTLLETLGTDRVALMRLGDDGRLRLRHALGFPAGFSAMLEQLPPLPRPCPERWDELPGDTAEALCTASGLETPLWVGHRRTGTVVMLGTPAARRVHAPYTEAEDVRAVSAALEVYVHIRELLIAEAALRTSEANYRAIFDSVNDGIAVVDPDTLCLIEANERLRQLFALHEFVPGRLRLDALGMSEQSPSPMQWARQIRQAVEGMSQLMEWEAQRPDGNRLWIELHLRSAEIGGHSRLLAVARDVTQRKEAEARLRHGALHDPLTGLPNRTLVLDRLGQALKRQRREPGYRFALMFLDLDRFKMVNDSFGHGVGDQLLVAIARRLGDVVRPGDTLARLGGDEFLVLLQEHIGAPEELRRIAERLQHALQRPFIIAGRDVYSSASIGIAPGAAGYHTPEEMLRDADIAVYHAKSLGVSRYELFRPEMHRDVVERLQIDSDLRRAVEHDELRAYYQPLVELRSGRISGFEALVRWQHPSRGLLLPGSFIPTAEESGMIRQIGTWMLHRVCTEVHAWHKRHDELPPFSVSVNLSPRQIASPEIVSHVRSILAEHACPVEWLHLEVTESALMENALSARNVLNGLRDLGLHLSIDDFGTGYSSLSYLQQFPIDILKIDRSFIQRMETEEGLQMVETIINLGHNLGMRVVAEGVEYDDQCRQLQRLGCDYGQGFLFARPVPPEAALELLLQPRVLLP